ncbi:MAG TPA: PPC domain-containing DNA-binding protein [Vicinamibacterales bacterium]|nr:PPC domain-containing DNA-binding protein [Vicinamibacterales bacterium]
MQAEADRRLAIAMKSTLIDQRNGLRTFVVVLATGEEAVAVLSAFAVEQRLGASHFTAIGAFSRAVVAYFEWSTKQYRHRPIDEQVEVLSLMGDITRDDDGPKLHAHVVLGKADATAHGGHLVEAVVRPTLEVVMTELPRPLHRRFDQESGLALIDLQAGGRP